MPLALAPLVLLTAARDLPLVVVDRDNVRIEQSCRVQIPADWLADADGDGVIHVVADGVTVDFEGQTLQGAAPGVQPDACTGIGVRITAANVTLRNAIVRGFKAGIWATRADGLVIESCDVSHNFRQRLRSTPAAEDPGDWLWPHHNDQNEWLRNYGAGIYIEQSRRVTVRDCTAYHSQNGLCLRAVEDSQVYDNDFSFLSGWGIALFRSSNNVFARNNCDFCVRGYSHGVYSRGQDSAGFLVFEQCHDNVFAYNSATHSGDGFFGYAGHEALDSGEHPPRVGCNRNLLYRNDFSYAPAIGIEMTFSFDNRFVENRLVGCNYGIWGGYSSDTLAEGNVIENNLIAGIAIEHGSNWMILRNHLHNNRRAVQLWWDEDPDLLAKPWARRNNTASRDHQLAGNRISVGEGQVGVELTGGTTGVRIFGTKWSGSGQRYQVDQRSRYQELDAPVPARPFHDPRLENLPGRREARGLRKHLEGREKILITEWGPYDWSSPLLHLVETSDEGDRYRLLGDLPLDQASADGPVELTLDRQAAPPTVLVRPQRSGVVTPYVLRATAGQVELSARGLVVQTRWQISSFAYRTDPREDYEAWKRQAADAVQFELGRLDLPFAGGGPSQLPHAPAALVAAGLPADRFGTIAQTRLTFPAGRWRILVTSDDGVRVYVDDTLRIDNWTWHPPATDIADLEFARETTVSLRVEHFELDGYAVLSLRIEPVP